MCLLGVGMSFLPMCALAILLVYSHWYELKPAPLASKFTALVMTAATVSLLEEGLFRGFLQGVIQRSKPRDHGIIFVALLFATAHFVKPPRELDAVGSIGWTSGFAALPAALWQFETPGLVIGGFLTLAVVGLILGYARWRTRSLWMPIGLHAGWVLGRYGIELIAKHSPIDTSPWVGRDILTGICPMALILGTGVAVMWALEYGKAGRRFT